MTIQTNRQLIIRRYNLNQLLQFLLIFNISNILQNLQTQLNQFMINRFLKSWLHNPHERLNYTRL